jgi:polygalacturonase
MNNQLNTLTGSSSKYKSVITNVVGRSTHHPVSVIALIIWCMLACLGFAKPLNTASTLQAGAQTPLLKPGKSQLVQQLEAIFYDDDFCAIAEQTFNAGDFGAVADGKTLNTQAIQKAIDAAGAAGGGRVTFSPGVYLSGALFIKTNVDFHIPKGVTIRAIQDDAHFPDVPSRIAGVTMPWPAALVNVYHEQNVRVSGKGTIDGNGKYWWDKFWGDPPRSGGMYKDYIDRGLRWAVDYDCKRVRALIVYESQEVVIKDVDLYRSGFWTISLTYSDQVHVDSVTIRNNFDGHFGPSSDGINTDSSRNILVENCDIDCNDDNLCLKAGKDADGLRINRPTERVVYRNCTTRAGHGLFTLGSETSGGMHDIEAYGLKAIGTNTGIRFKSAKVRGGVMRDIYIHDIEMVGVANPFKFELNWYPSYSYPTIPKSIPKSQYKAHWITMTTPVEPTERGIPEFHNMTFANISVSNARIAFYVNAYPEKPMRNMLWKNIIIEAQKPGTITCAKDWVMENVTLLTPSDDLIELNQVSNVQLPQMFKVAASSDGPADPSEANHILGQ